MSDWTAPTIRGLALVVVVCLAWVWVPDLLADPGYFAFLSRGSTTALLGSGIRLAIWIACVLLLTRPDPPRIVGWGMFGLAALEFAFWAGTWVRNDPRPVTILEVVVSFRGELATGGLMLYVCALLLRRPDAAYPARLVGLTGGLMIASAYATTRLPLAQTAEFFLDLWHDNGLAFVCYREVARVSLGCVALSLAIERVAAHRRVLAGLWLAGWVIGMAAPTAYGVHCLQYVLLTGGFLPAFMAQLAWWILAWLLVLSRPAED